MESHPADLCGPDPGDFAFKLRPAQGRCEAIWVPFPPRAQEAEIAHNAGSSLTRTHLASAAGQSENSREHHGHLTRAERLRESVPAEAAHDLQSLARAAGKPPSLTARARVPMCPTPLALPFLEC